MIDRLVILGSTLTALAVGRDAYAHGLRATVADATYGIAMRSRRVQRLRLPAGDDAVQLSALLPLGGSGSALVATGDPWVRFIARQRDALDRGFERVLHPANDALAICLDKRRFSHWCNARGLRAPRGWLAGTEPRPPGIEPPYFLRPTETLHGRSGHGLPKAVEAADEAALATWLARFEAAACPVFVSESLLSASLIQYSVPFARDGERWLSFVARKLRPDPVRCAVGTCVALAPHAEAEQLARRAAEGLDYFGIGEAEVLFDPRSGDCALIEINARPWLQYALAPASGHDFLELLTGRAGPRRPRVTAGRCWIDLPSDLFGAFSRSAGIVRRGELGLADYLRSLRQVNVFARFDPLDPAPAFRRA